MKRVLLETAGWLMVVIGIAALVLPGPGLLMLAGGLALLAREYPWAQRRLGPMRDRAERAAMESVRTVPRIAVSFGGVAVLAGLGVLWIVRPSVAAWWPLPDWLWLPGGVTTGVTLLLSAGLAGFLVIHAIRKHTATLLR